MRNTRQGPPGGLALPPLTPGLRNFLVVLFALYVLELVAQNFLGFPVSLLAWMPGDAARWWQPVTRLFVQLSDPTSVLFVLLAFYFFVPPTLQMNSRRELWEVGGFVFVGSCLLGWAFDLVYPASMASGQASLLLAMLTLFGLRAPDAQVLLAFIIPVPGRLFLALSGLTAGLTVLFAPGHHGGDYLGAFLGVLGWWFLRGPGKRRRELAAQGRKVEQELRRFTVLQGGQRDDDYVH